MASAQIEKLFQCIVLSNIERSIVADIMYVYVGIIIIQTNKCYLFYNSSIEVKVVYF